MSSSLDRPKAVRVRLDGPEAASRFTKMKASVRAELQGCQIHLDIPPMVAVVMKSCERVHFRLLEAAWAEVEPLVRLCERLHEEAVAAGGSNGWLADPEGFVPESRVVVYGNPIDKALWIRDLKDRYAGQEQRPWRFTAPMFMETAPQRFPPD